MHSILKKFETGFSYLRTFFNQLSVFSEVLCRKRENKIIRNKAKETHHVEG